VSARQTSKGLSTNADGPVWCCLTPS